MSAGTGSSVMGSELLVSPFLNSLPPPLTARYVELVKESLETEPAASLTPERVCLVRESLGQRLFALSREEHDALRAAQRDPKRFPIGKLLEDEEARQFYRTSNIIVSADELLVLPRYTKIEVELCTHCNLRCVFCPVHDNPKPASFIEDRTFEVILEKAAAYGIGLLSLNHYSEPTLDPKICERIEAAAKRSMTVQLSTNASLLSEEKVKRLKAAGNLAEVSINLPTLDELQYERLTGAKTFRRVLRNIEAAIAAELPVRLSINAPAKDRERILAEIDRRFESSIGRSFAWRTDSRAGRVSVEEFGAESVRNEGRLNGCLILLTQLNVNHRGQAFLCFQDYEAELMLGDLLTQSVDEVARSPASQKYRRWVLGLEDAPDDLICRACAWTEPRNDERVHLSFGNYAAKFLPIEEQVLESPEDFQQDIALSPQVVAMWGGLPGQH